MDNSALQVQMIIAPEDASLKGPVSAKSKKKKKAVLPY